MNNRELKFRVWDKRSEKGSSTKEMLYDVQKHHLWYDTLDYTDTYVVMQFTGLKDKNGKEIYEGDIVQYNRRSSYDGINFEVKWSEDNWGWVLVSKNKDYLINEQTPEGYRYEFIEIVGNIFENPDLLKQYARN